jgi:hypothetical protein
MESSQVALVVIAALLVGALIPAIVQFQGAMRNLSKLIRSNEAGVRQTVDGMSTLSAQLGRLGSTFDANAKQIQSFFESLEEAGQTIRTLRSTLRAASMVGAAVGPVVAAAMRARSEATNNQEDDPRAAEQARPEVQPELRRMNGINKEEENRR